MEHREYTKKEFEEKYKNATDVEKEIYDLVAPMKLVFCYCNRDIIIAKVTEMVSEAFNEGYGCGANQVVGAY